MAGRDDLAKIAYEMQAYREQAQLMQQQMANIQLNYASLELAVQTLENIKKISRNEDVLLPVGSGAYIKSKVENNEVALIDVGAGIIVEKQIPEAVLLLKARMKEIDSMRDKLQSGFEDVSKKMKELEESANKLVEKMKTDKSQASKGDEEYR